MSRTEKVIFVAGMYYGCNADSCLTQSYFKDSKSAVDLKRTFYDLYQWVKCSQDSLAISSLSILRDGHPFIPLNSPLHGVFERNITCRCRIIIIAEQMDTSRVFPSSHDRTPTWLQSTTSVAFSPDGRCLASAHNNGAVHIWDVATGESLRELEGHTSFVSSVAFSPDGCHLASGSGDHTVCVWDAATGARLRQLNGHTIWVNAVAFSADSCHLASGSDDHTVRVWDMVTGACIQELRHDARVMSVAFSPDGHYLASTSSTFASSWDDAIHVWDFAKGTYVIQKRLKPNSYRPNISFSAGGSALKAEYCEGPPVQLHFPSLETIDNPHPSPFYLDKDSLCVKHQGPTLHLCWLPDNFIPRTPVTQHGNCFCIGGSDRMIAFIDLDELALLDL